LSKQSRLDTPEPRGGNRTGGHCEGDTTMTYDVYADPEWQALERQFEIEQCGGADGLQTIAYRLEDAHHILNLSIDARAELAKAELFNDAALLDGALELAVETGRQCAVCGFDMPSMFFSHPALVQGWKEGKGGNGGIPL
ncbi:TPA: hypothetical protein ACXJU9_005554, partial [Pseudomonas aeruginosa]